MKSIISKLKNKKAPGSDQIPPEIWKAIMQDDDALQVLVQLCNQCWISGTIPNSWHKASVVTIFKKGNATDMNNYRPISLLQISYKLFRSADIKEAEKRWS